VHLVGFIVREFVTLHGHMNVKHGYLRVLWREPHMLANMGTVV
jgi:hypothetical protein